MARDLPLKQNVFNLRAFANVVQYLVASELVRSIYHYSYVSVFSVQAPSDQISRLVITGIARDCQRAAVSLEKL